MPTNACLVEGLSIDFLGSGFRDVEGKGLLAKSPWHASWTKAA